MRAARLEHTFRAGESSFLLSKPSTMNQGAELFHFWMFLEASFSDPLVRPKNTKITPSHVLTITREVSLQLRHQQAQPGTGFIVLMFAIETPAGTARYRFHRLDARN